MNCKQAETISIHEYLSTLGYCPIPRTHKGGDELRYFSPIRSKENTPSCDVNIKKNVWNDMGIHTGGGIIQLVQHLYKTDVSNALKILSESGLYRGSYSPPNIQKILYLEPSENISKKKENTEPKAVIKKVKQLENKALLKYLTNRKIDIQLAKKYYQEIYYSRENQEVMFFGLALENDSKTGYEVRNQFFKGFIGQTKTITSINIQNNTQLAIFEGGIDFITAISHYSKFKFEFNAALILNSTSLVNQAIEKMKQHTFEKIHVFLDNDQAGAETTKKLITSLQSDYEIEDKSSIYQPNKDLNEMVCSKK